MKVIRIDTNNKCKIIDWAPGDDLDGKSKDHSSLDGLLSKNLKLGLFGYDFSSGFPINRIATKIMSKLKRPNTIIPKEKCTIRGPVLLYDDDSDMTPEKWNVIRNFIKSFKYPDLELKKKENEQFEKFLEHIRKNVNRQ